MPLRPGALDYEGLSPTKRPRDRDNEACSHDSFGEVGNFGKSPPPEPKSFIDSHSNQASLPNQTSRLDSLGDSPISISKSDWINRRGHLLSYISLFLFSVVLYVRPYEFFPGLSSFTSMAFYSGVVTLTIYFISQISIEGNLTAMPREVTLVLLLGMAALLSMPLAVSPAEAWKTFSELLLKTIVIFVVIVNVVRTDLRLKLLFLLVLAVSVYLSVNAINDYRLGLFQIGTLETYDARIIGRIKGLFENSNDLALHLVTMIPIAVGLGLSKPGVARRFVYLAAALLMVGAVIVTFSRGGFIGLVASVLMLVRRLGRKNKAATTAALVFAVILFLALAPGAYSSRLSTIFDSSADLTASSSQRTEVLKRSIWVSLRYPLFGVGIGNFPYKSPRNLVTHNAYTQVSSEMGMGALVVYLLFLIHPLRRLRLIEEHSYSDARFKNFYFLSIGLQASLVGYMASSFFGAVAYQWYVYYLVAYAVCLHRLFLIKHGWDGDLRKVWERPFSKEQQRLAAAKTVS